MIMPALRSKERLEPGFPDPHDTVVAVNTSLSRHSAALPTVEFCPHSVAQRGLPYFPSRMPRLRYTFLLNTPLEDENLYSAIPNFRKIAFVDENATKPLEQLLMQTHREETTLRQRFFRRNITEGSILPKSKGVLEVVNITNLTGQKFARGLVDFINVHRITRSSGNDKRLPDSKEVIDEWTAYYRRHFVEGSTDDIAYVGYINGRPVTSGALYAMNIKGESIIQLGGLNTIPEFQGMGFAGEMLSRRLRDIQKYFITSRPVRIFSYILGNNEYSSKNLENTGNFKKWFRVLHFIRNDQ